MVGGLNRLLPKEIDANRFFGDSHWLEIWSNHFCLSMGPNGGSVAMDFVHSRITKIFQLEVLELKVRFRKEFVWILVHPDTIEN